MVDEVTGVTSTAPGSTDAVATTAADAGKAASTVAPAAGATASTETKTDASTGSLLSDAATKSPTSEPNKDSKPATDPAQVAASAPAPYDIKLPEGFEIKDQKQFDSLKEVFQKSGVPADKAVDLINYLNSERTSLEKAALQNQIDVFAKTNSEWKDETFKRFKVKDEASFKALPQYKAIGNMIDEFAKDIPGFKQALDFTGAGNQPDVLQFLSRIADKLTEKGFVATGRNANAAKPKGKANRLYDNTGA